MRFFLLLAWRNLWRNKRRTLLAVTSVFFAVFLTLLFSAVNYGQDDDTMRVSVSMSTGYLQVQGRGYWDERSLDHSIDLPQRLLANLGAIPAVTTTVPRLETVALVSRGQETRIAPVIGIVPGSESDMTGVRRLVVSGSYLSDSSRGVLIAEGLAERLHAGLGDSIVLFGQGYQGATAATQSVIEGILRSPIPKVNNAMVYLSLAEAQRFLNAPGRVTSVALMLNDPRAMERVKAAAAPGLDPSLVILDWKEMLPEVVQSIQANDAGSLLTFGIFYIVIAMGIFGTVMMMTIERTREFGLLIALGMKRTHLLLVSSIEALFVSVIGAVVGLILSFPIILYFHFHPIRLSGQLAEAYLSYGMEPIMSVNADAPLFYSQTIIVLIIAGVASLYPLFFIRSVKPVAALQGRSGKE